MAVLAIDQGTSGTKAIVVHEGVVVAQAEVAVRPTYLESGGVEQDPQALLESVLEAGREAVRASPATIEAVSLANQGESVLAWDRESGKPLSPVIVWQDRRAESICADLSERAADVRSLTGLVLDPYFSAPKMSWLRRNVTSEGVVTTTDSWLIHQLTGEFVSDASTASRSLLMDISSGEWDQDLFSLFGLGDEQRPKIVGCDTVVGSTNSFGGDIPLAGLIVDQQAALLAENCVSPGESKCTFGTGAFLLANTGTWPALSDPALTSSIAWELRGSRVYCVDGQVYTAASAIRWLVDLGLINDPSELDTAAASDSMGVFCVPAFAGLAAPWWQPEAKASFTGLTLSTNRGQFVRAVLEGISAQVATLIRAVAVQLDDSMTTLRVDGGLTQSTVLMQAVADIAQVNVEVFPSAHATALGAAALCQMSIDQEARLQDTIPPWIPRATFQPKWTEGRAVRFLDEWSAGIALEPEGRAS